MNTEDRIKRIIASTCGIDLNRIRKEGRLVEYGLDSVRAMDLLVSLEEEFSIVIPDDFATRARTMRDVVQFVEARVSLREIVAVGSSPDDGVVG